MSSYQDQFYNRMPVSEPIEVGISPREMHITVHQGQVPNVGIRLIQVDLDSNRECPPEYKNADGHCITPIKLNGYGAIIQVRGRVNSERIIAEFTHCDGLVFDLHNGIIWLRPTLEVINALPTDNVKREWVYDLILQQPTGGPVIVAEGKFIVYPRVTRVEFGAEAFTNDMPRPPDILDVLVQGIQGPRGEPGEVADITYERLAPGSMSALTVVWENEYGVVQSAEPDELEHVSHIAGITLTGTSTPGPVRIQYIGPISDDSWNFTRGRIWLGAGGTLTQTPPEDGYDVLIGHAVSKSTMYINIQDYIYLEE